MARVNLLLAKELAALCNKNVLGELTKTLQKVTSIALEVSSDDVGINLNFSEYRYNTKPLEISVVPTSSQERQQSAFVICFNLSTTMMTLAMSTSVEMRNFISAVGEIAIIVVSPDGIMRTYRIAD